MLHWVKQLVVNIISFMFGTAQFQFQLPSGVERKVDEIRKIAKTVNFMGADPKQWAEIS